MEPLLRVLFGAGSVFVCAIPTRYRRLWPLKHDEDLRAPAILSGTLEGMIGVPGSVAYVAVAMATAKEGQGFAGLFLNPFLPFVFLMFEGIVRMLAAVGPGQILPTLPLQIVAWIHDAMDGKARKIEMGPVLIDVVERGDGKAFDLCVLSCRAKEHWNPYMTIRYEGDFYQMFRQEWMTGPRRFAYFLRKNPEWRHVVVVYEYRPDDVLNPRHVPVRWKQPEISHG